MSNKPELLAPAGQPESGYAALHYGADAVYLGLNRFSARAEAVNFTPDELTTFVAHAHSLTPRRKVYLTLNTLVKDQELPDALKTLETAANCNVDAVIVQDWGIVRAIRTWFPDLPIHASTQMAIHNAEGARMATRLGCSRVTLARELTIKEVAQIIEESDIDVETFIHGTLCYAYSGLCLFSSMTTGRSGNRGKCVYSCREAAASPKGPIHPFSLKDMALGPRILDLAQKGVTSLKIEGRKKSPLYVAATVDYYRRILDGTLNRHDEKILADRLKTIFARPWTTLFLDKRYNPDAADTNVVGHRGAPLGDVETVIQTPAGPGIVLTPRLPIERHDGIQIDLPGQSRPYGFAVDNLYVFDRKKTNPVFAALANEKVAVSLPPDTPTLTPGLPIYLSSSQEVKRSYPFPKAKSGGFGQLLTGTVELTVIPEPDSQRCLLSATAFVQLPAYLSRGQEKELSASFTMDASCFPARDPDGPHQAAEAAFARTGGSRFRLAISTFTNKQGVFVKPGDWNTLRRDLLTRLEENFAALRESFRQKIILSVLEPIIENTDIAERREQRHNVLSPLPTTTDQEIMWSVCVDQMSDLNAFTETDFSPAAEVIVCVAPSQVNNCEKELETLAQRCGREKIRIALPLILRPPGHDILRKHIEHLQSRGWEKWFVSNPGALAMTMDKGADVSADWTLYALNALSARELLSLGCTSFTLSPEDDLPNVCRMTALYPARSWVVVYSDIPLFISAACVHSHIGLCRSGNPDSCPGRDNQLSLSLEKSGKVCIQSLQCGSVVVGERPFSLLERKENLNNMRIKMLRIDLRWRQRNSLESLALWRSALSGKIISGQSGNFERVLL